MSASPWMSYGYAWRGIGAGIQGGVYFWLSLRRVRISPFYLRASRNIPSGFPTRTRNAKITQRGSFQMVGRIWSGSRCGEFAELTLSLHQYPDIKHNSPSNYRDLPSSKSTFVEFKMVSFALCRFIQELGVQPHRLGAFHRSIG